MACGRDLFDFNGTFSGAGHGTFVGPRAAGARLVGAPPQASGREKFDFSIFRHLCAYQLVLAGNRQYQPLKCERCAAACTGFGCGVYYVNTTRRSLLFVCFCFRNTCLVLGAKCVRGLGCWPAGTPRAASSSRATQAKKCANARLPSTVPFTKTLALRQPGCLSASVFVKGQY